MQELRWSYSLTSWCWAGSLLGSEFGSQVNVWKAPILAAFFDGAFYLTFLGRGDLVSTTAWRPGIAISMTKGRQVTLPHLLIPMSFQQLSSNVDQVTHSISEL